MPNTPNTPTEATRSAEAAPKSIIEKVEEFKDRLRKFTEVPRPEDAINPEDNMRLAIKAIFGGIQSEDWEIYMEQFAAGNPQHLARLKAEDNTKGDPEMDQRRAYLVSGAICGSPTVDSPTGFSFGVSTIG